MVLARPSELAEMSFQFIQSHLRCLCSSGLLRASFLPLAQDLLNSKGSITYCNSSLGAHLWPAHTLALCLHKERQTLPHQRTGSALQIALVALLRGKIHRWQLPTSPTEDFPHKLQLAHFQEDGLCGITLL